MRNMVNILKNIFKKKDVHYVAPEDFPKEIEKMDKIYSISFSIENDKVPKEKFRKAEDFTVEKFDNLIKEKMISSNAEFLHFEFSLTYKNKLTGYKLKMTAKRNMKTNDISYKFKGVYGYFVPIFGKYKALHNYIVYYLTNYKGSKTFTQGVLKELVWRSVII